MKQVKLEIPEAEWEGIVAREHITTEVADTLSGKRDDRIRTVFTSLNSYLVYHTHRREPTEYRIMQYTREYRITMNEKGIHSFNFQPAFTEDYPEDDKKDNEFPETMIWAEDGQIHRIDGPAVLNSRTSSVWWYLRNEVCSTQPVFIEMLQGLNLSDEDYEEAFVAILRCGEMFATN